MSTDNPTAMDMIRERLVRDGFDGLYDSYGKCGCPINDLSPVYCLTESCQAGYKIPCDPTTCENGGGCECHYGPKPKEAPDARCGAVSSTGYRGAASSTGAASSAAVTGLDGRGRAGEYGCIALSWWNKMERRSEMRCARTGQGDGLLKPHVWYVLDELGELSRFGYPTRVHDTRWHGGTMRRGTLNTYWETRYDKHGIDRQIDPSRGEKETDDA